MYGILFAVFILLLVNGWGNVGMSSIHNERFATILQSIERAAEHPFVTKVIGKPQIPIFFVAVYHVMCQSLQVPEERARLYGVATTLLHMGLTLHEKVEKNYPHQVDETCKQQLYVLSGDYLSSLFYQQLALSREVEGIRRLSKATCMINEYKMALYMEHTHEDRYQKREPWELIKRIESELLTALADFFHVGAILDLNQHWKNLLPGLLLYHCLQKEEKESGISLFELDWVQEEMENLMRNIQMFPQQETRHALLQLINNPSISWSARVE